MTGMVGVDIHAVGVLLAVGVMLAVGVALEVGVALLVGVSDGGGAPVGVDVLVGVRKKGVTVAVTVSHARFQPDFWPASASPALRPSYSACKPACRSWGSCAGVTAAAA